MKVVDIMHQVRQKKLLRSRKKRISRRRELFFVKRRTGELNEEEVLTIH